MIRVNVSGQLKEYLKGGKAVEMDGPKTVASMVGELDSRFPGIKQRIFDDQDRIRAHVNVFVNGENVRELRLEQTKLSDGDSVHILPSVAGG